jgi:hypothetical protein
MMFRSRPTTAKGDERLMKKWLSPQTERKGFLNRNRKTHQRQCQKEKETPNDVSELGVVVVDLERDEVFGSSTQ